MRVAVAGLGYWGPNIARNLAALEGVELAWCCDPSEASRERLAPSFPGTRFTGDLDEVLADDSVDAVALATPVPTHAALALRVLGAGKHCFVEKPMAQSTADAEAVVAAAEAAGKTLMVGHLLEYHPGVVKLKELIDGGELGRVLYIYGNRLNLGQLRADENALWSLGAHDVSVLLRLAGEEPYEVEARGESYMREGVEDVVFCFLRFPSGLAAHLHLSLAGPAQGAPLHRRRRVADGDLRRHGDRGQDRRLRQGLRRATESYGEYIARSGDIWSPRLSNVEPLRIECEHFVRAVREGTPPISDGAAGLRVVRVLEALQRSLDAIAPRRARPHRRADGS